MSEIAVSALLRAGLLEGVSILVAGTPESERGSYTEAVTSTCTKLGGRVGRCGAHAGEEATVDEAILTKLRELGGIDVLVVDAAALFAQGRSHRESANAALRACLQASWNVTRAFVNCALLASGSAGRIIYLAPDRNAGDHVQAARAGLENLARTLSVEWARHEITVVSIALGAGSSAGEVGTLVAYLASPAGAYFSGCLLGSLDP